MILALEGPDGCGKTTLYHALAHRLRHPQIHFVKWGPLKDLWRYIVQLEERDHTLFSSMYSADHLYVCDRFCAVTGPIYARVYDRPTLAYYTGPWEPDGLVVCYLHVSADEAIRRREARGSELPDIVARHRALVQAYDSLLLESSRFKHVEILDGTRSVEQLLEDMNAILVKYAPGFALTQ